MNSEMQTSGGYAHQPLSPEAVNVLTIGVTEFNGAQMSVFCP